MTNKKFKTGAFVFTRARNDFMYFNAHYQPNDNLTYYRTTIRLLMMLKINLSEAKARLGYYLKLVCTGERIIVCERNRPIAELKALPETVHKRALRIGVLAGKIDVPDDFDEPMVNFEADFYDDSEVKHK